MADTSERTTTVTPRKKFNKHTFALTRGQRAGRSNFCILGRSGGRSWTLVVRGTGLP
jgi:hypothetical protein